MPFKQVNIDGVIQDELKKDPEFKKMWEESRMEYKLLAELLEIRKKKGLSQSELAEKSGNKQQVISRIENKENSPTLKTICSILDVLDYDIQLVPRHRTN